MLSYNEIKPKKYIVLNKEPFEVLSVFVLRKQQRRPVNQTKLRSLVSGKVIEHTFQQKDTAEEADIEIQAVKYLYNKPMRPPEDGQEWWFSELDEPSNRFKLEESVLGEKRKFLKENSEIEALVFNKKIIDVRVPIKVVLKVTEAPPSVKGNTAQGGVKPVTLETGAVVTVPMFVKTGDLIEINTETGEYVRRIE